jgi:hypothetical protein
MIERPARAVRRADRPTITVVLKPELGISPVQALRAALKLLLRRYGLRAVSVEMTNDLPDARHQPRRQQPDGPEARFSDTANLTGGGL